MSERKPLVGPTGSVGWKSLDTRADMGPRPTWKPLGPPHPTVQESPVRAVEPQPLPELLAARPELTLVRSERYDAGPTVHRIELGPSGDRYEVEVTRFKNGLFVRAPSFADQQAEAQELRTCQDTGALGLDAEGELREFAMGDGVGDTLDGAVAARRATAIGLDALRKYAAIPHEARTMRGLLRHTEVEMQNIDLPALKRAWVDRLVAMGLPRLSMNSRLEKLGVQMGRDGVLVPSSHKPGDSGLSSTTLTMGCIQEGRLKMASCGDGGWFVLRAAGGMVCAKDDEAGPPFKVRLAGGLVDPAGVEYVSHELGRGDAVFCFSDGLRKSRAFDGAGTNAGLARRAEGLFRQGCTLEQLAYTLLEDAIGGDDNSILAFTY